MSKKDTAASPTSDKIRNREEMTVPLTPGLQTTPLAKRECPDQESPRGPQIDSTSPQVIGFGDGNSVMLKLDARIEAYNEFFKDCVERDDLRMM